MSLSAEDTGRSACGRTLVNSDNKPAMGGYTNPTAGEIKRLQTCINDLVSVQALASVWRGCEPRQIIDGLLEILVRVLRLDFAYADVQISNDLPFEAIRLHQTDHSTVDIGAIGRALAPWLKEGTLVPHQTLPNPVGAGWVYLAQIRMGVRDEIGVLVCASQRTDFPTDAELVLSRVAANQAVIGLQEARSLWEQKRAIEELERQVSERTANITAGNDTLRIEIVERKRAEEELRVLKDELAAELTAMTRLHQLSTRPMANTESKQLLKDVLHAAILTQGADFGMVQLYNRNICALEIVAQQGFQQDLLDQHATVDESSASICGHALRQRQRIVVEDVETDPDFAQLRPFAQCAGIRAAQSIPLFSNSGDILGMISIHFRRRHQPTEHNLRLLDLFARHAAHTIERQRVEEALRASEDRFRLIVESISDYAIFGLNTDGIVASWNIGAERITGYGEEEIIGRHFSCFYSAEEIRGGGPQLCVDCAAREGRCERQGWRMRKDGTQFWADVVITAIRDKEGTILGYSIVVRDITERKLAEDQLRRSETYLAEGQRLSRTGSWAWNVCSGDLFWSKEQFCILGVDPEHTKPSYEMAFQMIHPEDRSYIRRTFEAALSEKSHFEGSCRIIRPDGASRQIHAIAHPALDELGNLVEYVGTVIDVTEEVEAKAVIARAFEEINNLKERLHNENVVLREQFDRTAMFEEIVGSSAPIKSVLSRVAKVAPTESTVLIGGETGTGKELIARAIHKRSNRKNRPFIAFNCASVPTTLIASELFGHEKGAFTGAQQRRLGRFELAEGGTLFLDEVGELPAEAQIALLRVLQEREFERLGGTQPMATDVRIICATNRDLADDIAAGTFRLDLFYRLNVFPIEMPPLRERREDIPLLLDYFIQRYAEKAGKRMRSVEKRTIELSKLYSWPGNIRELQNVVERSVIVCESENFSIDHTWLSAAPIQQYGRTSNLGERLRQEEKKIIEAALAESKGRIAGRHGAAARLGIPSSTLESKIKTVGIKKNLFKPDD